MASVTVAHTQTKWTFCDITFQRTHLEQVTWMPACVIYHCQSWVLFLSHHLLKDVPSDTLLDTCGWIEPIIVTLRVHSKPWQLLPYNPPLTKVNINLVCLQWDARAKMVLVIEPKPLVSFPGHSLASRNTVGTRLCSPSFCWFRIYGSSFRSAWGQVRERNSEGESWGESRGESPEEHPVTNNKLCIIECLCWAQAEHHYHCYW